jgi:hypothetical protein
MNVTLTPPSVISGVGCGSLAAGVATVGSPLRRYAYKSPPATAPAAIARIAALCMDLSLSVLANAGREVSRRAAWRYRTINGKPL